MDKSNGFTIFIIFVLVVTMIFAGVNLYNETLNLINDPENSTNYEPFKMPFPYMTGLKRSEHKTEPNFWGTWENLTNASKDEGMLVSSLGFKDSDWKDVDHISWIALAPNYNNISINSNVCKIIECETCFFEENNTCFDICYSCGGKS